MECANIWKVASSPKILAHGKIPGSVSKTAAQALQHLKVDIMLNTSVVAATKMPNGQQELTLSGGEQLITDMYIPTYGLIPNSSYIPSKFLDKDAFVMVDDHLAVKGTKNIWAIGDVSDTEFPQYLSTERQSKYLAKAMSLFLRDMPVQPYKAMTARTAPPSHWPRNIWLTPLRRLWVSNRQIHRNWPLWWYEDSRFHSSLYEKGPFYSHVGRVGPGDILLMSILVWGFCFLLLQIFSLFNILPLDLGMVFKGGPQTTVPFVMLF